MGCCGGRSASTINNPVVIGAPDGSPARLVRALITAFGIRALDWAWVTGTDVDLHIAASNLQPDES